jgi:dynein heavy chain/atypical dual specificity phosphatase
MFFPNLFGKRCPKLLLGRYPYNVPIFGSPTEILNHLFLGGLEDAELLARENPHQIVTVITLSHEPVVQRVPGIRYLQFPVRDARPISIAWLNAILTSIEESMTRGSVLVHCGAGMSRAPTVVAALLDRIGFLGFARALSYLEGLRPIVAPSRALVESIERELPIQKDQEDRNDFAR